jgi:hypothetical protein
MMAVSNWAQLYAESLVDVSDIAEEIGKAQGGYFNTARAVANDGKKWIAMPYTILGLMVRGGRHASRPTHSRRPGPTIERSEKSSKPKAGRLVRRWPMLSVIATPSA